jgi:type II secretory pathway component GspD/PulD (secretin)
MRRFGYLGRTVNAGISPASRKRLAADTFRAVSRWIASDTWRQPLAALVLVALFGVWAVAQKSTDSPSKTLPARPKSHLRVVPPQKLGKLLPAQPEPDLVIREEPAAATPESNETGPVQSAPASQLPSRPTQVDKVPVHPAPSNTTVATPATAEPLPAKPAPTIPAEAKPIAQSAKPATPSPSLPAASPAREPSPAFTPEAEPALSVGTEGLKRRVDVIELRDVPLGEALRAFSEQAGFNMVASPEAQKVSVSLYLRNVTGEEALEALCKANDLWCRKDLRSGVLHVYTAKEYHRDLAGFREEQTEVFTLMYPNPADVAAAIHSIYGDRVVMDAQSQSDDAYQHRDERGQNPDPFQGAQGNGGGGRRQDPLSENRSARREGQVAQETAARERTKDLTPEEIEALEAEQQGRLKAEQQAIIQRMVQRRQASIFVTVIRPHNQLIVRTSDEKTMEQIRELVAKLDIPTPLVLLEVKILQVELGDGFHSAFDYQLPDGPSAAGGFTSGNVLPPHSDRRDAMLQVSTRDPRSAADTNAGAVRKDQFLFQVVNDNFRYRMQFLEDNNRVTTLATPLLLTANNEVSRLFVGEEVPINRSFSGPTPLVTGTGTAVPYAAGSTGLEFRPVGTTLLITPNINADRTVTLRVLQEVSEVQKNGANVLVPTNTGFANQAVDTVRSRTVSGTVVGKDAMTVAIGGLIRETVVEERAEVPPLGKLPVVGIFFRRQCCSQNVVGRSRQELVILIRPYVFQTPAESAAGSCQWMRDVSLHSMTAGPERTPRVSRANPPASEYQNKFRLHGLAPKTY